MYANVLKTRYDFELKNDLGSVQGSTTLVVEEDISAQQHSEATDVVEKTNSFESNPIAVDKFGEYVGGLHLLNNKAFEIQFKVCCCCCHSHIPRFPVLSFRCIQHNVSCMHETFNISMGSWPS